ncbi:MAG: glutamyl-tRNA reductase [Thermoguttaceae bacterium]
MGLFVIGCSHHHTPIALRERLSFSQEQIAAVLQQWHRAYPCDEVVLLSTCNRTEFYIFSSTFDNRPADALAFFLASKGVAVAALNASGLVEEKSGREAAIHLFSVASGLDSMVVGEVQVLGQVKQAYRLATEAGTVGSSLHALFQAALRCAKRIDVDTQLHQHRVSVPAVAVMDIALKLIPSLSQSNVLILGAGEMAEETLRLLVNLGVESLTLVNRNRSRAESLAARYGGKVDAWDQRLACLAKADLAICTTGAEECVVTAEMFRRDVAPHSGERSLLILDLAVPRDIDPNIGTENGVTLYSIDDLNEACNVNRASRDREVPLATALIEEAANDWETEMRFREAGEVIARIRDAWSRARDEELERLRSKLSSPDTVSDEEIAYAFERLINKLLHPALAVLRRESATAVPQKLIDAITQLFLQDGK